MLNVFVYKTRNEVGRCYKRVLLVTVILENIIVLFKMFFDIIKVPSYNGQLSTYNRQAVIAMNGRDQKHKTMS